MEQQSKENGSQISYAGFCQNNHLPKILGQQSIMAVSGIL